MIALSTISVMNNIGLKATESDIMSDIGLNFLPISDIQQSETEKEKKSGQSTALAPDRETYRLIPL
jgi:hypothetical protein